MYSWNAKDHKLFMVAQHVSTDWESYNVQNPRAFIITSTQTVPNFLIVYYKNLKL